jgi:hypothetical protein
VLLAFAATTAALLWLIMRLTLLCDPSGGHISFESLVNQDTVGEGKSTLDPLVPGDMDPQGPSYHDVGSQAAHQGTATVVTEASTTTTTYTSTTDGRGVGEAVETEGQQHKDQHQCPRQEQQQQQQHQRQDLHQSRF